MDEAVLVENLRHQYGPRTSLDGVSFQVNRGECIGVLGPNGGGKSTLFRILSTLLSPLAGRALVFGNDVVEGSAAVRRKIGVVFQSPSLDIYLTTRENLLHAGHLYGLSGTDLEARIADNLTRFGVNDRANERVKQLSGGLRRRVELAKCLLHKPSLLIMDEPSTGLDPVARRELWDHLEKLRRENDLTILLTTHDMEEAERCDRVLILDHGRAVAVGRPAELTAGIAANCISIESDDAPSLAKAMRERFSIQPNTSAGTIRIFEDRGPAFPGEILAAFDDLITSLTVSKPTLADVFLQATGRTFEVEGSHS